MSQPTDSTWWLAWVLPVLAFFGALWAVGVRIFNTATRTELAAIVTANVEQIRAQDTKFLAAQASMEARFEKSLEEHKAERQRIAEEQKEEMGKMHRENREVNTAIGKQLGEQDKAIARIEGRIEGAISGRYPTIDPHAR